MNLLTKKIWGCLLGGAIGNAMGSIVENWSYEKIQKNYGKIEMPLALDRIQTEDDNRIALLYVDTYLRKKRNILPEDLAETWIENFDPSDNFFWCMRNSLELLKQGISPRQTGIYNINTGSALMAISPVGIYNMFEPERAHSDALDLAYMYQPKPDAISAAAYAAGLSEAFKEGITVGEICDTILKFTPFEDLIYWDNRKLSNPYKSVKKAIEIAEKYRNDWWNARPEIYKELIQWHPIDPVEVLSISVCLFKITDGNYEEGCIAGTNIGRDADTITNLIGALCGAMHGIESIPDEWKEGVEEINQELFFKFRKISEDFSGIIEQKIKINQERLQKIEELL